MFALFRRYRLYIIVFVVALAVLAVNLPTVQATAKPVVLTFPFPASQVQTVYLSKGPHRSEFRSVSASGIYIDNANKPASSLDLAQRQAGTPVVAPLDGIVKIFADCGSGGQIVFIWSPSRDIAVGLTHIRATVHNGQKVTFGQLVGHVLPKQDNRCGTSTGPHLHLTLLSSKDGKHFHELDIVNTPLRLGQWQVANDTTMYSVLTNKKIHPSSASSSSSSPQYFVDWAKIVSAQNNQVLSADHGKVITFPYRGYKTQQWNIVPAADKRFSYFLVSRYGCMTADGDQDGTQITYTQCWQYDRPALIQKQKFTFVPLQPEQRINGHRLFTIRPSKYLFMPDEWVKVLDSSGPQPKPVVHLNSLIPNDNAQVWWVATP